MVTRKVHPSTKRTMPYVGSVVVALSVLALEDKVGACGLEEGESVGTAERYTWYNGLDKINAMETSSNVSLDNVFNVP